jgi:hypothetical protein
MPMLRGRALTALVLALVLGCAPAWAQVDGETTTPGSTCNGGVTAGHGNRPDWDTIFECNGSTQWQRGAYFFGSSSDTCDSNHAGMVQWTGSAYQACDGTNWDTLAMNGGGTCSAPSGLSFTNVSSASLGTVYTSGAATITFTGCTGTLSVSVTGAATAQISVNGGAWTTSGAIASGQTLQVRLTSSGSASTMLTATITVGGSSTNWTVTTRTGSLQVFLSVNNYEGGTIGGLSGADAACQSEAGAAGYAGTYKAIMSDDSTSAASRLTLSYPIVNAYNGSTVAAGGAANLWVGWISNEITTPTGGVNTAWTGSNSDGSIATGYTCSSWSSTSGTGVAGYSGSTNSNWLNFSTGNCSSSVNTRLYCIQQ